MRNDSNNIITLLGSQCKTLLPPCNNDKESEQLQQVICKTSKYIKIIINYSNFAWAVWIFLAVRDLTVIFPLTAKTQRTEMLHLNIHVQIIIRKKRDRTEA